MTTPPKLAKITPVLSGRGGRVPLYVQIRHEIRTAIASGALATGDRIPSETELVRRFGTTRATVTRALQELVYDGTIIRRVGSGSFVAPAPAPAPETVTLDTGRVRSFEQQFAESGGKVTYTLIGFRPIRLSADAAAQLSTEDKQGFLLERLRLLGDTPVSFESRIIVDALGSHIEPDDLARHSVHAMAVRRLGLRIARVETAIFATSANRRLGQLLVLPRGRPVLVREHLLIGPHEHRLAFGRSFYTERFRLTYITRDEEPGS